MAEVTLKRSAARTISRLDKPTVQRMQEALHKLAENPDRRDLDVKPLTGEPNAYRLRVGDWRVLFERQGDHIIVQAVRSRGDAYKSR
jgi:mRNA interferase RelE/StbE